MSKCTWERCDKEATHPQIGQDGKRWANLCEPHHVELDASIGSLAAPIIMRAWIKAQGGSKSAAKRMTEGQR